MGNRIDRYVPSATLPSGWAAFGDRRRAKAGERIIGLDLARAVAVLGMFVQHFYDFPTTVLRIGVPSSWPLIVNNNSTVLFAVLAGISKSLIDGGRAPLDGSGQLRARMNIVARAVMLFAISGVLVTYVPTPGSVLGYIAAGFIISLPFLRLDPRTLLTVAAVGVVVLPYPVHVLAEVSAANSAGGGGDTSINLLVTGSCPALIFLPLYLLGIALGRVDLHSGVVQFRLLVSGVIAAVASYSASAALVRAFGSIRATRSSVAGHFAMPDWRIEYFLASPHLNGVLQMTAGLGVALVIIGVSLVLTRYSAFAIATYPIRALGMCAFTAYVAQFVVVAVAINQSEYYVPDALLPGLTVGVIVLSTGCIAVWGRGPLESAMTAWARWMSSWSGESGAARPTQVSRR